MTNRIMPGVHRRLTNQQLPLDWHGEPNPSLRFGAVADLSTMAERIVEGVRRGELGCSEAKREMHSFDRAAIRAIAQERNSVYRVEMQAQRERVVRATRAAIEQAASARGRHIREAAA